MDVLEEVRIGDNLTYRSHLKVESFLTLNFNPEHTTTMHTPGFVVIFSVPPGGPHTSCAALVLSLGEDKITEE